MNPYEVLEISAGASPDEIKAAYHGMAKKWHPDRYTGAAKAEAEQRFRMLAEAYSMLKDTPARGRPPRSAEPRPNPADPAGQRAGDTARDQQDRGGVVQGCQGCGGRQGHGKGPWADPVCHPAGCRACRVPRAARQAAGNRQGRQADPGPGPGDGAAAQPQGRGFHHPAGRDLPVAGHACPASRLWNVVHNLAPNHPIFSPVATTPGKKGKNNEKPGLGEQFNSLVANAKEAINRILKRG